MLICMAGWVTTSVIAGLSCMLLLGLWVALGGKDIWVDPVGLVPVVLATLCGVSQLVLSIWSFREAILGGSPHHALRFAVVIHGVTLVLVLLTPVRGGTPLSLLWVGLGIASSLLAARNHRDWLRGE
jgi:uncharacterized membrane protein YadS